MNVSTRTQKQIDRAMSNPQNVKPGQVWEDNDPRTNRGVAKRTVKRVEPPYAFCENSHRQIVRIRLDRFGGKGTRRYTLVQDV